MEQTESSTRYHKVVFEREEDCAKSMLRKSEHHTVERKTAERRGGNLTEPPWKRNKEHEGVCGNKASLVTLDEL